MCVFYIIGNNFCSEWACYEAGLSYFHPCLLWCLMPSLLTLVCLCMYYCDLYDVYDVPDDFWGFFTLNYHMVNNFVPLCLSPAVLFLGGVPAWLIYLGISFVMQLFLRWWWLRTSKVARSPVRQFDMSELNSVGLNIPVPTAAAYNEPSAPPIAKVDDPTHTVTMTQAEKEMFEIMKRLQARDQTAGRVV